MGEPPSLTQRMGRRSLLPAPLHPDPADPPSRRSNVGGESGRMRGDGERTSPSRPRTGAAGSCSHQGGAPPPQGVANHPGPKPITRRGGSLSYPDRKAEWTGRGPTPARFRTQSRNANPQGEKVTFPDQRANRPPHFYKEQNEHPGTQNGFIKEHGQERHLGQTAVCISRMAHHQFRNRLRFFVFSSGSLDVGPSRCLIEVSS